MDYERYFNNLIYCPHLIGHAIGYDKLTQLHSNWINYLFRTNGHRALRAHRDSYKTTSLIIGVIRELLFNPELTILILRKNITDAMLVIGAIKGQLEKPSMQFIFKTIHSFDSLPGVAWSGGGLNLSIKKKVTVEHNIDPMGIGGRVTGKHYDIIVVDDIIDRNDRMSRAERENVKTYVQELINVIKKPDGKIIFSGTPWHADDAWDEIKKICKNKIRDYPYDKTGIISPEKLQEIKDAMSQSLFDANYRLVHTSDEDILFSDAPEKGKFNPLELNVIFGVLDKSFNGSDHTALWIGSVHKETKKIHVKGFLWEDSIYDIHKQLDRVLIENSVSVLHTEVNDDKGGFKKTFTPTNSNLRIKEYSESMNKHYKITTYLKKYWSHLVFSIDPETEKALQQVMDYTEYARHDDSPDALASLVRLFTKKPKNKGFSSEAISL